MTPRSGKEDARFPGSPPVRRTVFAVISCLITAVFCAVMAGPLASEGICGDKGQPKGKAQKVQKIAEDYGAAKEAETSEIVSVRHITSAGGIKLIVELTRPVEFQRQTLLNPDRVFFDLKNTRLPRDFRADVPPAEGLLKRVRMAQNAGGIVRIVFDLEGPDYTVKTSQLNGPPRIVIDLRPRDGAGAADETVAAKPEPLPVRKKIVIDPGHGGDDPGAVGPRGTHEKDIVLDIALRVRDIFRKEAGSYEVMLTRETDVFIPLEGRSKIANAAQADLFVSVHANASVNRQARGIETYILNWTNDAEALKVAARENAISLKKMEQVQNELSLILASLERESKRDDSVKLAGFIQNALVEKVNSPYHRGPYNGLKQALFYVLVGAHMPSALVEVGFISNREEERLLTIPSYRQRLAEGIAEGIRMYFEKANPLRMASVKKTAGVRGQGARFGTAHSN